MEHGKRIIISVIEQKAREEPNTPWISIPVDNDDLAKGYQSLTYFQLNNAANNTAQWLLKDVLSLPKPFQCFAYAGPKDLRYPILALAAGKLRKKLLLPNLSIPAENYGRVLRETQCEVYLSADDATSVVEATLQYAPEVRHLIIPGLSRFMGDAVSSFDYKLSWDDAKDDPWLIFLSSGTTGPPKPITHTFRMVATLEAPLSLPNVAESHIHQYRNKRWYTHLPTLHFVGMTMMLLYPAFTNMTAILAPPNPDAEVVAQVLRIARADGALCTPLLISQLTLFPAGLEALRRLEFVHYAGAPLSRRIGDKLVPYTKIAPLIGCTESGHHFTETRSHDQTDWDHFIFQAHAGVRFEHHAENLYEMVFVRNHECAMQPIFITYPHLSRFETGDLWVSHPEREGLWKIVGRKDDFISLADARCYLVSPLEYELGKHPQVATALIGGNGCVAPVLLLELLTDLDAESQSARRSVLESLDVCISRIRKESLLELSLERTIFAPKDKPFVRTIKGTVARVPTLKLYEEDINLLLE